MFDESTSVSVEICLLLYIRIYYDGEICNFYLDLVTLKSQRGQDIADAVFNMLLEYGFSEECLRKRLIGICSDGAISLGEMNGALAILKAKLNTNSTVRRLNNLKQNDMPLCGSKKAEIQPTTRQVDANLAMTLNCNTIRSFSFNR